MIQNPYIVGNPIENSSMFFGRDDDFSFLETKMQGADQGGIFVLCGTRRSGKTSVLFQILKGRLGTTYLPALVDMQSYAADGDAGFVLLMAEKISAAAALDSDEDMSVFQNEDIDFPTLRDAFISFCRRIQSRSNNRKLVLMFDEYQLFEDAIEEKRLSGKILGLLGDMVRGDSGIFLVMAGSTKLEERDVSLWAPCLGQSMYRRISFLSHNDAQMLIHEPVKGLVQYEDKVPEAIWELGSGQPFYTQVICQGIVDRLNEMERTTANVDDVDQVVREIVDNPLPHMIFTWGSLTDVEKVALAAMAEIAKPGEASITAPDILDYLKQEKTGISLAPDRLNEALEHLFIEDLLHKDRKEGHYCFRMGLWHHWILRMHSLWQVLEEIHADGHKPGEGVIQLARRRLGRIIGAAVLLSLAVGLYFINETLIKDPIIVSTPAVVVVPDSTYISFRTVPAGGRFFLGDRLLGVAPRDSVKLQVGHYNYRVELDGYHDINDTITLREEPIKLIAQSFDELTGSILVSSTPPNAEIIVNGEVRSEKTPATISDLPAHDVYKIKVRLAGFLTKDFSNQLVFADSTITVHHNFLRPRHPLTIVCTPPGADIWFDGTNRGPSPLNLSSVVEGSHKVRIQLAGYHEIEKTLMIPGPRNRIEFDLQTLPPGNVLLRVQPYADIYIDGELVKANTVIFRGELNVGEHIIEFKNPLKGSHKVTLNIESGETSTVNHNFLGEQ